MRVRATLACGWCGRQIEMSGLEMNDAATIVYLPPDQRPLARQHGRPVCSTCGGPLLLDAWERLLRWPLLGPAALAPAKRGRPRRSAMEGETR